jgi:hypothetical protein
MKKTTLILLAILSMSCQAQQKNNMKDYEKAVDTIIHQIIALKSKHPEQLRTIEDARIEKEITAEKFWLGFHYDKGKNTIHISGTKKTEGAVSFEEDGIELNVYFFKGDWTGTAAASIIPFGDLNIVIFIENDKNGLYQDIEDVIVSEKRKLKLKNPKESAIEDYKKAIELAEALMIKKELVPDEYNLVKLQNQFLYGKDEGMTASSVWKIIYKTKNTNGKDEYNVTHTPK